MGGALVASLLQSLGQCFHIVYYKASVVYPHPLIRRSRGIAFISAVVDGNVAVFVAKVYPRAAVVAAATTLVKFRKGKLKEVQRIVQIGNRNVDML